VKASSLVRVLPPCLAALGGVVPSSARAGFADCTAASALTRLESTWGAAFTDLDRDGALDLYVGHHFVLPTIFWNDGSGVFDSTAHPAPWSGPLDRHGVLAIPLAFDELPDLFIAHGSEGGTGAEPNELYRNDGNGILFSISGAGGMADGIGRGRCASAADYNGDRKADVWIGKAPDAASPNSLFRNVGLYSFVDVAAAVGLDETDGTVGGIWGDVDGDGDPDLLVGGEEFPRPTKLWRNDGTAFSDASSIFSPPLPIVSGADWGDYDADGDLDLALCDGQVGLFDAKTEGDTLRFFFNTRYGEDGVDGLTIPSAADTLRALLRIRGVVEHDEIFLGPNEVNPAPEEEWLALTDVYVGAPTYSPGVDRGIFVWRQSAGGPWELRCTTPLLNYDTFDGKLVESAPIMGVTELDFEDSGFVSGGPKVWRNDGGTFQEITDALGLPAAMVNPRDVSWVDYDNDGDLDLHVVDMGTSLTLNAPDALFRNDGASFTDVTAAESVAGGSAGLGDGAVWGDVDRDGDLDVFVAQGAGPVPLGGDGPALYYRNDGAWPGSVQLHLAGRQSGPAALGAKVTATLDGEVLVRAPQANSWRGFADPIEIHIGMGSAALVDSLVIEWPSGNVHTYVNVPPGFYRIDEGVIALSAPPEPASGERGWRIASVEPQPARAVQTVVLAAERSVVLAIRVYDLAGRLVRALHDGPVGPGATLFAWDGRDARGRRVAAGVYFVRATGGADVETAKAVRIR
jgi:hypothetical protein